MPSAIAQRLREQRKRTWEQAKGLADRAADENRAFEGEEQRQWDSFNAEIDTLDERIKSLLITEQREREISASFDELGYKAPSGPAGYSEDHRALNEKFRDLGMRRNSAPIEIPKTSRRAMAQPGLERAREEQRVLNVAGPSTVSGFAGITFYDQILQHLVESSAVLRAGATVINTSTGEQMAFPKTSAFSTAAIVTEGGTIGASDPTLGTVNLFRFKYGFYVQVSYEMLRDASFDVTGFLASETATAIGLAWGGHAITGTGSTMPRGVLLDATLGQTGPTGVGGGFGPQATAAQGGDQIAKLLAAIPEVYTRKPSFGMLMSRSTLQVLRVLRDSNSRYIFDLDDSSPLAFGSGSSGAIFGVPVYVDPFVPAIATAGKSVIAGDWSRVYVRHVQDLRFERSDDFAFTSDLVTFRGLMSIDSALIDTTGALQYFAGAAT